MKSNSMFDNIRNDLAENFDGNNEVLRTKIDRATTIALSISNRINFSADNKCKFFSILLISY